MADSLSAVLKRPFAQQLAFLRQRLSNQVPTRAWDDLWKSQHDHAFMVAGAMKADLLADLAAAVERSIAEPTTADLIADRLSTEAATAHREWLRRIEQLVEEADSMEALRDALLNAFSDLPTGQMTQVMQAAFAVAELAGRFEAGRETQTQGEA